MKPVIKEDACMKFYGKKRPLYLQIDASEIGLGVNYYRGYELPL